MDFQGLSVIPKGEGTSSVTSAYEIPEAAARVKLKTMAQRRPQPTYFQLSRSAHYSIIFALPLLLAYEALALLLNQSDLYGVRNSADVFLKLFLSYVGIHGFFGFGAAIVVALLLFHWIGGVPRFGHMRLAILAGML